MNQPEEAQKAEGKAEFKLHMQVVVAHFHHELSRKPTGGRHTENPAPLGVLNMRFASGQLSNVHTGFAVSSAVSANQPRPLFIYFLKEAEAFS